MSLVRQSLGWITLLAVPIGVLVVFATPVQAVVFDDQLTGSWSDGATWDQGTATPEAGDAIIKDGDFSISVSGNQAFGSSTEDSSWSGPTLGLQGGNVLTLATGATLTHVADSTFNYYGHGPNLAGDGTFINQGTFVHDGNDAAGGGDFDLAGTMVFQNEGTYRFTGAQNTQKMQLDSTGVLFHNTATGTLEKVGTTYIAGFDANSSPGKFLNEGTINVSGNYLYVRNGSDANPHQSTGGTFNTAAGTSIRLGGYWSDIVANATGSGDVLLGSGASLQVPTAGLTVNVTGNGVKWSADTISTNGNLLQNDGLFTITAGGTKTLSGGGTFRNTSGTLDMQSGTVTLSADTTFENDGTLTFTTTEAKGFDGTGTVQNRTGGSVDWQAGTLDLATGVTLQNDGNFTIQGSDAKSLDGNGELFHNAGTLTITDASVGGTGTLRLGSTLTSTGTSTVSVTTVDLNAGVQAFDVTDTLTVDSQLTNGGLTKQGAGTLNLGGATANTFTGQTTVEAGTLRLNKSSGNAIGGDVVVNGGILQLVANNQIVDTADIVVNNAAWFDSQSKSDTIRNLTLHSSTSNPNSYRLSNLTITETLTMTDGAAGLNSGSTTGAETVDLSGGSRIDMAANTDDTIFNIGSGGLTMSGATLRFGWSGIGSARTALVNLSGNFTGSGTNVLDYLTTDADRQLDLQAAARTFNITDGTTTIDPTIQNGSLIKDGGGMLVFGGEVENTYTGLTTVSAGTLKLSKSGVVAIAGDILLDGGVLQWGASNQIADTSSITVDGGRLVANAADDVANIMINSAASTDGFHLLNGLNITGTLTITAGDAIAGSGGSAQAAAVNMTGGKLAVAANSNPSTFSIGSGGLTMAGATVQLGYDGESPTALVNLGGDFTGSGTNYISIVNTSGPRLLDLQGETRVFDVTSGTTTIAPTIQNGGLTKDGAGVLVLTGDNTYIESTTVAGGTLWVNGSIASGITVDSGAILGGSGIVHGNATVNGGLAAGTSPGTLTFMGDLDISGADLAGLQFELGTTSDLVSLVDGGGSLALGTGVIGFSEFSFTALTGFGLGTYTLFDTSTVIGGALDSSDLTGTVGGFQAYLALANGGEDLVLQVVPEPSLLVNLLAMSLAGLLIAVVRKRKK